MTLNDYTLKDKKKTFFLVLLFLFFLLFPNPNTTFAQTKEVNKYYSFLYKGQDCMTLGDFEKAEAALLQAKTYGEKNFGARNPLLFFTYNGLGILNKQLGKYQEAVEYYSRAVNIIKSNNPINEIQLAIVYSNISNIYRLKGDYESSLQYNYSAINYYLKDSVKNFTFIINCKNNIANTYFDQHQYKKAIHTAFSFLQTKDPQSKISAYEMLSRSYTSLGQKEKALKYYQKEIALIKNTTGPESPNLGITYNYFSTFLIENNEFNQAKKVLNQSLSILLKNYGPKHFYTSYAYQNLGNLYEKEFINQNSIENFKREKKRNLFKALNYYHKAVESVIEGYNSNNPFDNPPIYQSFDNRSLQSSLKNKAGILSKLSELAFSDDNSYGGIVYLKKSLETYKLASDLIQVMRNGFLNMESKLYLAESENSTYLKTIETAYKLYEHTGNRNYLYLAFEYAERSKAAVFLSSIRDLEAKHFSGIPDSLLVQEENIKQEISFYKDQIFQLKQSGRPDSNRLKLWTNILLKKTQEQEDLTHYFEKNYPRYYSFKYNSKVTGVNEIQQKLKIKDVLVEYVVNKKKPSEGKSELYCFTISKDNFQVTKSNADQNYDHAVKIVQHFLINSNAGATKKKDYQSYSLSAYHLYNKLLAPFQKTLKDKNLIVVPDDQLAYIPFDALISQMPDTTKMDFRKLHYLIKDYPISYSYSATLLFDREKKGRTAKNSVLAFAPNYSIKEKNFRQPTLWSHLLPLAGAAAEANNISKIFRADIFSGKQASEYNFKKIAPDYDILHLAMHTMVNDSMPMFSKLIFTASKNQDKDDNILSTQEIYNMKLNARLAVLSACNTGSGKLQKGEGVMSMARGFLFAGCPGIVMTLWEVDDKSSADLMGNFYEFIKKGKSKDEALRMAKLKHLEESDALMAHPYFWQSYVIIGDTEPLYAGKEVYLFSIGLFLIASWILYDLIKIRKRKKASGKNLRP